MNRARPGAILFVARLFVLVGGAGAVGAQETNPKPGPEVLLIERGSLPYGLSVAVFDELPSSTVLRVTAAGFEPEATGVIEQCAGRECANSFPVSFDLNGRARLQYLVTDAFTASSTCRADAPPCVVRLRSGDARDAALVTTVFHDAAPAPRQITVTPSEGGVVDGAPVLVTVSGFTPGERVHAMLCAAPDTFGPTRCGAPGPVAPFRIDTDGTGRTALVIRQSRVGTDHAPCGRDSRCGVVVVSEKSSVPGAVFPFTFAAGPGAHYDASRLLTGLGIAAALLALAFFLARTTDWRKPTEADTPDLDAAIAG